MFKPECFYFFDFADIWVNELHYKKKLVHDQ